MNLSAPFIQRPVGTTLLTIAITLAGIVGFQFLPVAPLPQVDFPTIQVNAALPGASPETMASSVAAPLERQFGRIAGVTEMTSTSYLGSTSIVLQFDLDRDIDGAARDVQAAINAARNYLPPSLPSNPTYRKVNPGDAPIFIIALTSDTLGAGELYDAASSILQQRLSRVEGVGQVFIGGSSLPAVRIDLNPSALAHQGLSLADVRAAITATTLRRPKGQLTDGAQSWEIETNDQIEEAAQFRPVVIKYVNGAAIRLSDVATVEDSVEDLRTAGFSNDKSAALVVLFRSPNANIIETIDHVRAALPQLRAVLPAAIKAEVVLDRSPPIRGSLRDVELTLLASVILVTLVVFAFLRNVRAALIPTVAVPVSLIGTFGVMYLCGYSLNNLSLMALTIATGFVVDDAIVVLENTGRHVEQGVPPREAAMLGAKEIGFTVLSMSLSLVAVFIPILLMGGMVGRLFREFAATLTIAIAISLVVSMTTTPMMCAALLRHEVEEGGGRLYRATGRALDWMHDAYRRSLAWALRHPRSMVAVTLLMVALNVTLFMSIPKGFFPQQDNGRLGGTIQAAQDISFQAMQQKLAAVVDVIRKDPAVDNVLAFTGGSGGGGSAKNSARMFIVLKPPDERPDADTVAARLRPELAKIPGAPTYLSPVQDLRIGGRGSAALYQFTLQAEKTEDLAYWAPRLTAKLREVPGFIDVNSDQQDQGLEASLVIDRDAASRLGLTAQIIDEALYDAFGQRQVAVTYTPLNQYHVVMEVAPPYWQRPETLNQLYIRAPGGAQVPLASFASYQPRSSALAVNHQAQFPSITISFNLAPGFSLGEAVDRVEEAAQELGMPSSVRATFAGTAQAFEAALKNQPILILAALVAVYITLGILYESYVHPITILSTLPSAGVGALLALMLCGTDLSVIALIGIFLLIGIVKKNAIMMIDFALESERTRGVPPEDAIYEASLLRFRPIMMTTMAALLGALPLAIGVGMGGELRQPLGIAIVGGLIVSQALTLYTTPVIYLYLDRFRLWFARIRSSAARRAFGHVTPVILLALLFAAGCTVGPDYVRPTTPMQVSYKETKGWKVAEPGGEMSGSWWKVYGDAKLDSLVERVQVSNQNLAVAEAQFRQARALVGSARSNWYPTANLGVSVSRARQSSNLFGNLGGSGAQVSDYAMPLSIAWEADVWGRIRRLVESSEASAQASAADVAAVRLSLEAELATDYFQLRTIDAQRKLLDDTVAAYQRSLELVRNRYAEGIVSGADVAQAETQLETTRAQAIDLEVQRAQLEHAIAVLVGEPPASFSIATTPLDAVPPKTPVGVPSEILERRPDVAASERNVAAANAQIGVAEAAYYPTVTLSATGGFEASDIGDWFTWPSRFWSVGPAVTETVYDGGLRASQTEEARAAYDGTVAAYRQSVLTAFQEVEDSLSALRILENEARVQSAAVRSAKQSVELTINRYEEGTASYIDVVTAQAIALANERNALDVNGRRMASSVQLVTALGGGWSAAELPTPEELVADADEDEVEH